MLTFVAAAPHMPPAGPLAPLRRLVFGPREIPPPPPPGEAGDYSLLELLSS